MVMEENELMPELETYGIRIINVFDIEKVEDTVRVLAGVSLTSSRWYKVRQVRGRKFINFYQQRLHFTKEYDKL